jgi:hypothetical protein
MFLLCALLALSGPVEGPAQEVDFVRDVRPLLESQCLSCHGPAKQKGRLRLDSKASAFRGGASGPGIVAGKSGESRLYQVLVTATDDDRMPQDAPPLAKEKIELIRAWIDQGAAWPDAASIDAKAEKHWAYVPPLKRAPPAVRNAAWVRNPVDAFVAQGHERRGLAPRPEAPREALLRRVMIDLIGLPPTREELRAFLDDASPGAYEKVVDALLADPRHGERWGRHWMDVWRYSDWYGYGQEIRNSQPHLWRWRDWIVESLNADKGYDRMLTEMLAGDELAPEDPSTLRATGFLGRNWYKFNRSTWLQETVEHTSKAFLATTMNCARCHGHFFDPITHEEYYRFRAFFEPHNVRVDHVPGQVDALKDGLARVYDADLEVKTHLFLRGDDRRPDTSKAIPPGVPAALGGSPRPIEPIPLPAGARAPEKRPCVNQDLSDASEKAAADARSKAGLAREKLRKAEDARAGKPDEELEKVGAAVLAADQELGLAEAEAALAAAKQASLAAVIRVERIEDAGWKESDAWKKAAEEARAAQAHEAVLAARLAVKGDPKKRADAEKALQKAEKEAAGPASTAYAPRKVATYPAASTGRRLALARWIADRSNPLAARVAVNHVWMRHFGKALVPSAFDFGSHGQKPTHPELLDWLAVELMDSGWSLKKLHRLIVTSSAYREDSTADAASLKADPENQSLWRMNPRRMESEVVRDAVLHLSGRLDLTRGGPDLDPAAGLTVPRRSLYFRHAQEKQVEFLALFDAANVNECYRRTESIVPQQALALANSPLVIDGARLLARKLGEAGFVAAAYEQILGRLPTSGESAECFRFLEEQARLFARPDGLTRFGGISGEKVAPSPDPALRAREDLVLVLFNVHDFVTVR